MIGELVHPSVVGVLFVVATIVLAFTAVIRDEEP